jgi:hypothetical protein
MDKAKAARNTTLQNRRYVFHEEHEHEEGIGEEVSNKVLEGINIEMSEDMYM